MKEANMSRRVIAAFALVWAFVGAPLAWSQPAAVPSAPPPSATLPPAVAAEDFDYKLGPGDKIRVIVFNEPDLSGEFFVSSAGKVSFPLIGELDATGVSLETFRQTLQGKLAAGYLKDPRVSVEVLTYRPFYILGEVNKPGEYPYTSGLTMLKGIATAGGFTYRAQTNKVYIQHLNQAHEEIAPITAETPIEPGDTIRVIERFF